MLLDVLLIHYPVRGDPGMANFGVRRRRDLCVLGSFAQKGQDLS
jgi:hypothetical protein